MKKFWLASLLLFTPALSHGSIQDPMVNQEKTYVVHFTTTVPANSTAFFDLISLSTTAALFPHTVNTPGDIGEIDISEIHVVIDKVATASTTVKIGVCTFITPSTASISYVFSRSSLNNVSNTDAIQFANYTPAFYRCRVKPVAATDGTTPCFLTNEKDSNTALVNSTTTLPSPIGTSSGLIFPRLGDIIMKIVTFGSSINYIVDVWYHAEP